MSEQKELVQQTIKDLTENMDLFYQQKNREALERFMVVLAEMTSCIDGLKAYQLEHTDFPFEEEKTKEMLDQAMKALEDYDMVLLADILQYDFVEYLQSLSERMD